MEPLLSSQAAGWREWRRRRAWELHQEGWTQTAIAKALGVTQGSVSQWLQRANAGLPHALRHRPSPGAPPQLAPEQRAPLPALLAAQEAAPTSQPRFCWSGFGRSGTAQLNKLEPASVPGHPEGIP